MQHHHAMFPSILRYLYKTASINHTSFNSYYFSSIINAKPNRPILYPTAVGNIQNTILDDCHSFDDANVNVTNI